MEVRVDIAKQELRVYSAGQVIRHYEISTAKNGLGELRDSEKTPRGWHIIRAKIGAGKPENTVFVERRSTGEIYTPELGEAFPERDWILTRICWLSGLEVGKNRLGSVDTMQRYIYIHGTPDTEPMGVPLSHGCIRMRNHDLIEFFDLVPLYTKILI